MTATTLANISMPLLLAEEASIGDGLALMVVGMFVVFLSLTILLGVIVTISRLTAEKPAPKAAAQPAPVIEGGEVDDPALIAVIAAAATAAMNKPIRIQRVSFLGQAQGQAWSQQGRRSIMTSHRPG